MKRRWARILGPISDDKYRANLAAINILFGAVLGVVMGASERLQPIDFSLLLMFASVAVSMILGISLSPYRGPALVLTLLWVAMLPLLVTFLFDDPTALPPKLQPTLAVWAIMTFGIEIVPHVKSVDDHPSYKL